MRDKSHGDQIERWAKFMIENPDKWKKIHTEFINAQFQKSEDFIKRLAKTQNGKEKIIEIYGIKNKNAYKKLFSK